MNLCPEIMARFGTFGLSEDDFNRAFGEWDHRPVIVDGRIDAALLVKGSEVHLSRFNEPVRGMRRVLAVLAREVLAEHGCMTTTVPNDDTASRRYVERLGFKPVGECAIGTCYRVESSDWRF